MIKSNKGKEIDELEEDTEEVEDKEEIEDSSEEESKEVEESDSELEEEVLEDTPIDFSGLQNWIASGSSRAPVLNQVEIDPGFIGPGFGIAPERAHRPMDEEISDSFKYHIGGSQNGETKYITDTAHINSSQERLDFTTVGRTSERRFEQGGFFTSSKEIGNGSENIEKYVVPDNFNSFNVESAGRKDPFKRPSKDEVKYDPKLPSY